MMIMGLTCHSCKHQTVKTSSPTYLFLGNSITYGGRYVDYIETAFLLNNEELAPKIVNLGLSSETLTGISEDDHPFPRPSLLERLSACLDSVQPDHVIACYGINCGIYHPFDSVIFTSFKTGIQQLIREVRVRDISLTLLTPGPFASDVANVVSFDSVPGYSYRNPYKEYDKVMEIFSEWILSLDTIPEVKVVDIRSPLKRHTPLSYSQQDPIHPNATGHAIIAEAILDCWNVSSNQDVLSSGVDITQSDSAWLTLEKMVQSQRMSYDRSLLNRIGHQHPVIMKSITSSWEEARSLNQFYDQQIDIFLSKR